MPVSEIPDNVRVSRAKINEVVRAQNAVEEHLESLNLGGRVFFVEYENDPIPAEASEGDYVAYTYAGSRPPVTAPITLARQLILSGVSDGASLPLAGGAGDTALNLIGGSPVVRVNGTSGLREIDTNNTATATQWRWTGLSLPGFSIALDYRHGTSVASACDALIFSGVGKFSTSSSGWWSLNNATPTYISNCPAFVAGSIYRIRVFRNEGEALTHIRFYNPDGTPFWSQDRDLGTNPLTALIMGKSGATTGQSYWSNIRLDDVGTELV